MKPTEIYSTFGDGSRNLNRQFLGRKNFGLVHRIVLEYGKYPTHTNLIQIGKESFLFSKNEGQGD